MQPHGAALLLRSAVSRRRGAAGRPLRGPGVERLLAALHQQRRTFLAKPGDTFWDFVLATPPPMASDALPFGNVSGAAPPHRRAVPAARDSGRSDGPGAATANPTTAAPASTAAAPSAGAAPPSAHATPVRGSGADPGASTSPSPPPHHHASPLSAALGHATASRTFQPNATTSLATLSKKATLKRMAKSLGISTKADVPGVSILTKVASSLPSDASQRAGGEVPRPASAGAAAPAGASPSATAAAAHQTACVGGSASGSDVAAPAPQPGRQRFLERLVGSGGDIQEYREHCILGWSQHDLYQVVADVEKYAEFLPWCVASDVHSVDAPLPLTRWMTATLSVGFAFLKEKYTSEVELTPNRRITAYLFHGSANPILRDLECIWEFLPVADDPRKVEVFFAVKFGFKSPLHSSLIMANVVGIMTRSFEKRCERLYGSPSCRRIHLQSPVPSS